MWTAARLKFYGVGKCGIIRSCCLKWRFIYCFLHKKSILIFCWQNIFFGHKNSQEWRSLQNLMSHTYLFDKSSAYSVLISVIILISFTHLIPEGSPLLWLFVAEKNILSSKKQITYFACKRWEMFKNRKIVTTLNEFKSAHDTVPKTWWLDNLPRLGPHCAIYLVTWQPGNHSA